MSAENQNRTGAVGAADSGGRVSFAVWLMLIYLWYFIATPDTRFLIFGEIHFERILVAFIVLALFAGKKITRQVSRTTVLVLLFFLWALFSYFQSPYRDITPVVWWIENYWKYIIFYFFMLYSIRSLEDLFTVIAGVCVISFLYQLHTWYDYVNGGSYVYQQGLKRIVGVWSGGGIGAANAFGLLGLVSLPFGISWLNMARRTAVKIGLVLYLGLCFASIAFSGTRAAVLGALVLLVLTYWRSIFRIKVMVPLIAALAVSASLLPDELKHRYFEQIVVSDQQAITDEGSDRIADESAQSRIQGLKDGWALVLRRPIIGYGPASSGFARREVNATDEWVNAEDEYLELHNLYGQVMAETGFVGTFIFVLLVAGSLLQLHQTRRAFIPGAPSATFLKSCHDLILTSIILMIFYGIFTHSLYRYYWLLLFAFQVAFVQIVSNLDTTAAFAEAKNDTKTIS